MDVITKHFNIKINPHYIVRLSPYRAVNTHRLGYKTSQLMLYREIIAVCSEIHTKHINTVCGQNVGYLNIKFVGIYNNHLVLKSCVTDFLECGTVLSSWMVTIDLLKVYPPLS